jgi:hypothetical protein
MQLMREPESDLDFCRESLVAFGGESCSSCGGRKVTVAFRFISERTVHSRRLLHTPPVPFVPLVMNYLFYKLRNPLHLSVKTVWTAEVTPCFSIKISHCLQ